MEGGLTMPKKTKTFCKMCPTWEIKQPERCSNTLQKVKKLYFCTKRCKDRFNKIDQRPPKEISIMASSLLKSVRSELKKVADPTKAPPMQAYMKSVMPYHGVPAPLVDKLCKAFFAGIAFDSFKTWNQGRAGHVARGNPQEKRYIAITLSGHKSAAAFQTLKAMPLYEELIVTGAWWDYVDVLAIHRVGPILAAHPAPMRKMMLSWSKSKDIWKRRTSIICQTISLKAETNFDLLHECIERSMGKKGIFCARASAGRFVRWRGAIPTK